MSKSDQHQPDDFSIEDLLKEFSGRFAPPSAERAQGRNDRPEASLGFHTRDHPGAVDQSRQTSQEEDTKRRSLFQERSKTPKKPPQEERDWQEDTITFPSRLPSSDRPSSSGKKTGVITAFPGTGPINTSKTSTHDSGRMKFPPNGTGSTPPKRSAKTPPPTPSQEVKPEAETDKVLEFPAQGPVSRVAAHLARLRRQADEFADHMFEDEDLEAEEDFREAEETIPEVDDEKTAFQAVRRQLLRLPAAPDIPPAELGKRFERDLSSRRFRRNLVFLLSLVSLYVTLAEYFPLPIFTILAANRVLRVWTLAGIQCLALMTAADTIIRGFVRPFQLRAGMDTLIAAANIAVLFDALTLPHLAGEDTARQPYCAISILSLFLVLHGELLKRKGQRMACRVAASASHPYLVTRDEDTWNGRDTYAKWSGAPVGFGSQIQGADGAEQIFRFFAPVMLIACLLFSLLSSIGRNRPENFLWCLAATLTASASLSATLCYGPPWYKLCNRLAKSGAAFAGWEGVANTTGKVNLLVYDADLFPPGAVTFNGVKIYGDFPTEKVISVAATVIRDAGSGLEKPFHDLLRSQGGVYRRGENLEAHDEGGLSEFIRGEEILVGSGTFMSVMEIPLPPGLHVKNAVFCAIDGELAGVFALKYHLPPAAAPALDALIHNRIIPVLATRDFNLTPDMLQTRFRLPGDRMEFPLVERRWQLSDPHGDHSNALAAVLCREGIAPYAEAMVGAQRLRTAVRLSAVLACAGSFVGGLLAFYLTFVAAYASLTPLNLLIFLLMWLVPTPLITGWVERY